MSAIFTFSLYVLSFAPLWISILFIDLLSIIKGGTSIVTELISIILIPVCFIAAFGITLRKLNEKNGSSKRILMKAKVKKLITSEFLLSYILPLFAFDFTRWDQVIIFLIFFFTIALLIIKHHYFSENVVLEWMGYRFFECELKGESDRTIVQTVISKNNLAFREQQEIEVKSFNNDMMQDITN